MRGHYFEENNPYGLLPVKDNRPQVIPSPETPATFEDVKAIVAYLAHGQFQREVNFYGITAFPKLAGISQEQFDRAIREALA